MNLPATLFGKYEIEERIREKTLYSVYSTLTVKSLHKKQEDQV